MEASRLILDSQSWTIPQVRTSWAYRQTVPILGISLQSKILLTSLCAFPNTILGFNAEYEPFWKGDATYLQSDNPLPLLSKTLSFYCCYIYSFGNNIYCQIKKVWMAWLLFLFPANHLLLGAVLQNASNQSETMVFSFFHFHLPYQLHFWLFHHNTKWIWT